MTEEDVRLVGQYLQHRIAKALGTDYSKVEFTVKLLANGESELTARRPDNDERDDDEYNPRSLTATGATLEALEEQLAKKTDELRCARAFASFLTLLPADAAHALRTHAERVLSIRHKVYLGDRNQSKEQFAIGLLEDTYREEVANAAEMVLTDLKNGEIKDSDQYYAYLCELPSINGEPDAYRILLCSNNADAGEDESHAPMYRAAEAFIADVTHELSRYGLEPSAIEERECAACGNVVVWTEDPEECPRCNLSFEIQEKPGHRQNSVVLCDDCIEDGATFDAPLPTGTYKCSACSTEYYNPKGEDLR